MRVTVYGPGGYDPKKKNNNVVEEHDAPEFVEAEPTVEDRIAALEAAVGDDALSKG